MRVLKYIKLITDFYESLLPAGGWAMDFKFVNFNNPIATGFNFGRHTICTIGVLFLITALSPLNARNGGTDTLQQELDSLSQAKTKGRIATILACEKEISNYYMAKSEWQKATLTLKEYNSYLDTLTNATKAKQLQIIEERDSIENALALKNAEADKAAAIIAAQSKFKFTFFALLLLVLFATGILTVQIYRYRRAGRINNGMGKL